MRILVTILTLCLTASLGHARQIYVSSGAQGGNGSASAPFGSVGDAIAQAQGGDEILLAPGRYGKIFMRKKSFSTPLVIRSAEGKTAIIKGIDLRRSDGLTFRNLTVEALGAGEVAEKNHNAVHSDLASDRIRFENLDMRISPDAANYRQWTKQDWSNRQIRGVLMRSPNSAVTGTKVLGFSYGITAEGANSLVEGNDIEGFSGDGIRLIGSNGVARSNYVHNCVKVSGNHDDGLQSWTPKRGKNKGLLTNLTIEGNTFFEWDNSPESALKCTLQGIGMFDGIFENVTIRNNVISVSSYHGIALYGGRNAQIYNNTVTNPENAPLNRPWIRVNPHKDGRLSENVRVYNNIAHRFIQEGNVPGGRFENNAEITSPQRLFRDPAGRDYRLRDNASGIKESTRSYQGNVTPLSQRGAFAN
ncbi:right-handed parallel beta-helix repeat-containing protein [Paracoccaceae bacterium GXU_MW_L88]